MKKASEIMMNPLWITPVALLLVIALIEGSHTGAHIFKDVDVHGYCKKFDFENDL